MYNDHSRTLLGNFWRFWKKRAKAHKNTPVLIFIIIIIYYHYCCCLLARFLDTLYFHLLDCNAMFWSKDSITLTKCIQFRIEFLEITRVICGDRIFRVCVIWFTWSDDKFQSRRRKPKLASFFRAGFLGEGNMNYYRRKCDLLQKSNLSNNLTTDMEREGLGNPCHIGNEKNPFPNNRRALNYCGCDFLRFEL